MDARVGLESWAPKNWCFWTVVLEETLESPLDRKEIQPVSLKGNQPWIFIGRTDVEAETPILWPPDAKSWLIGKDPDAGKVWGQEEKGTTEDEVVGWHHWLDGHGFGYTLGVGDGQGGLVCCSSWVRKESDMTEWLNWTELSVKWSISCHINKQDVTVFQPSKREFLSPGRTMPAVQQLLSWQHELLPLPTMNKELRMWVIKSLDAGPRQLRCK